MNKYKLNLTSLAVFMFSVL